MLRVEDLLAICPYRSRTLLEKFVEPLSAAMEEFEINTPKRQAAFIAQIAHESGGFKWLTELASGDAYEGRLDLGNSQPGDGRRFKGRGLIQITGRANYAACGAALGLDLLARPEQLSELENACRSAAWFWESRGLNDLADADQFKTITRRINGGLNGFEDRKAHWERAKRVFGVQ